MSTPSSTLQYQESGVVGVTAVKADYDPATSEKTEVVQIIGPGPGYYQANVDSLGRISGLFSISDSAANVISLYTHNPTAADFAIPVRSSDLRELIDKIGQLVDVVSELSEFFHKKG